jgi:hypothetical protein
MTEEFLSSQDVDRFVTAFLTVRKPSDKAAVIIVSFAVCQRRIYKPNCKQCLEHE